MKFGDFAKGAEKWRGPCKRGAWQRALRPLHVLGCPSWEGGKRMATLFQQSAGIEFAPLQDEVILFHSPSNKFCVLNRTSSFIWSQLKEPVTSEEIAHRLGNAFGEVDPGEAMSDTDTALKEMLGLGLIVSVNGSDLSGEVNR
jgi:Coenzyme PQQ synthesis protein D (PqqD)